MNNSDDLNAADKKALRKLLLEQRLNLPDRAERAAALQQIMRIWLVGRPDTVIGAYWPIKGEFDPLPALHRWKEDGELLDQPQPRRIGLPVVNKQHKTMIFHAWYPGCPMEEDAYGIPKPKDTEVIVPTLLFAPCVGYGPGGYRLLLRPHAVHPGAQAGDRRPGLRRRLRARFGTRAPRHAAGRHSQRLRGGLAGVML